MKLESVFRLVGRTPALRLDEPTLPRLFVKLEGQNPTGSVKDRACVEMLERARRRGRLAQETCLLDASSGNFACSMSYFGHVLGLRTVVVCNSKLTAEKRTFIEYFGAELLVVGDMTIEGNEHCRQLVAAAEDDTYLFLDQLHNWANPWAHFKTTGPELVADFPKLAVLVGSLGSGGSLCGVGAFLRSVKPEVRIVAVEAASGTRIPGTAAFVDGDYITPFIARAERSGLFDLRVSVTKADVERELPLLRRHGLFCGPQTAGLVAAARLARERWPLLDGDVVLLSGDAGWKNLAVLRAVDAAGDSERALPSPSVTASARRG
jgi:[CysO sulfur-carrier protein]-thiocarboxylate-dependent cysteine synthase